MRGDLCPSLRGMDGIHPSPVTGCPLPTCDDDTRQLLVQPALHQGLEHSILLDHQDEARTSRPGTQFCCRRIGAGGKQTQEGMCRTDAEASFGRGTAPGGECRAHASVSQLSRCTLPAQRSTAIHLPEASTADPPERCGVHGPDLSRYGPARRAHRPAVHPGITRTWPQQQAACTSAEGDRKAVRYGWLMHGCQCVP